MADAKANRLEGDKVSSHEWVDKKVSVEVLVLEQVRILLTIGQGMAIGAQDHRLAKQYRDIRGYLPHPLEYTPPE